LGAYNTRNTYFLRALLAYNFEFDWEILFEASSKEELNDAEKSYIWYYMSTCHTFGYNLQKGGTGEYKRKYTEEQKELQRSKLKGRPRRPEHIKKIADMQRGVPRPKVAKRNNGRYIDVDDNLIFKLHNQGLSLVQISKELKITKRIVRARLNWNGIIPNPASNSKKIYDMSLVLKLREQGLFFYEISNIIGVSSSVLIRGVSEYLKEAERY